MDKLHEMQFYKPQPTINLKDGKMPSPRSRPAPIITFLGLHLPVSPFVTWLAYQVATVVSVRSWKAMMDAGQDPREGIFPSSGLIVSRLLAMVNRITLQESKALQRV